MKHLVISFFFSAISFSISAINNPPTSSNSRTMNVQIDTLENNLLYYKIFNPSGVKTEEAFWKDGKNVGEFKRYHDNGALAQLFIFNEEGKRVGEQKYFFENGEERLTGKWSDGKMNGRVIWYNENGEVDRSVSFKNGKQKKRNTVF